MSKPTKAEKRRDEDYQAARNQRDEKRDRSEDRLIDAMGAHRESLREIENEYYDALDIADRRCERAMKRAGGRR